MGNIHTLRGNYTQALEQYQKSLTIVEELGDKAGIARILESIGLVHGLRGNYNQAFDLYQKSLKIREELSDKAGIALTLNHIGVVHRSQGNYAQALEQYQKSLKIREELSDKAGIALTLNNIGNVHGLQTDYTQALEQYQKSLKISEEINDQPGIARTLNNIGVVHRLQGDNNQALERYHKSLKIREEIGDKAGIASTLNNIGDVHILQGNHTQAIETATQALTIAEQIGLREVLWNAHTTAGKAYRALNRTDEARQAFKEAIVIIESLRTGVAGREARATYFVGVLEPYEAYIDLLMQLQKQDTTAGFDALAFEMSERSRARSLLELLTEARADIRQGVDPTLLERERALLQILNAKNERRVRLLSGKHTEQQVNEAKTEIDKLATELQQLQVEMEIKSPRYAHLTQPQPLSAQGIQQQAVDGDTLLLEYALGDERSYLWAVSPTSILSFELPKRAVINDAAGQTGVRRTTGPHSLCRVSGSNCA